MDVYQRGKGPKGGKLADVFGIVASLGKNKEGEAKQQQEQKQQRRGQTGSPAFCSLPRVASAGIISVTALGGRSMNRCVFRKETV